MSSAQSYIRQCWQLGWRLALAEFKLKHHGSYLGHVWYLLNPFLLFIVLYAVFFERLGEHIVLYPGYLAIGVLVFNFFTRTTLESTNTIIDSGFLKSLYFPREALVLSVVLKNIFSHALESIIFFSMLSFFGVAWYSVLLYLAALPVLALFILGVSFFLAATTVYVTDLGNVWQFFTTAILFLTPIFYALPSTGVVFLVNLFNPLSYYLELSRATALYGVAPEPRVIIGAILYAALSCLAGWYVFSRLKVRFAERI